MVCVMICNQSMDSSLSSLFVRPATATRQMDTTRAHHRPQPAARSYCMGPMPLTGLCHVPQTQPAQCPPAASLSPQSSQGPWQPWHAAYGASSTGQVCHGRWVVALGIGRCRSRQARGRSAHLLWGRWGRCADPGATCHLIMQNSLGAAPTGRSRRNSKPTARAWPQQAPADWEGPSRQMQGRSGQRAFLSLRFTMAL